MKTAKKKQWLLETDRGMNCRSCFAWDISLCSSFFPFCSISTTLNFQFWQILSDELHSSSLPLIVGVWCFFSLWSLFQPWQITAALYQTSASLETTLAFPLRTDVIYGAIQEFSLPISPSPWALLVFQLPLWLLRTWKKLHLFPKLPPNVLLSWLQAALLHICAAWHFWLLLLVTFCRVTAYRVKIWHRLS